MSKLHPITLFLAVFFLFFVVGCASTPSTTVPAVSAPVDDGTPDLTSNTNPAAATATIPPQEVPEAWTADDLIDSIDPNIFKMAVMIPYGGHGPSDSVCSDFWTHHWDKHITGPGSPNTGQEILEFLAAVENGEAELTKAAAHAGGGLVSLFKYKGQQWLMFIGDKFLPSIYRPTGGNIQGTIRNALGRNTLQQPSNKLKAANQTAARCFRESAPEHVLVEVPAEVEVPISQFTGVFDLNSFPIPAEATAVSAPEMVPTIVGSYGMDIPIAGTPPAWGIPDNYVYDPAHAVFLWSPDESFGLTPYEMAQATFLLGSSPFVVIGVITTAEFTLPVVVVAAPAAGQMLPAFAP